jgi:tetratricopeptide (TPR) repeat protein
MDGTLDLTEKKNYQQQILARWQAFDRAFPNLERHWEEWARALNNMAWLQIMDAKPDKARPLLARAAQLAPSLLAIPCNLAHCDLLEGNSPAAKRRYGELWDKSHRGDRLYGAIIRKDLKELVRRGHLKDKQLEGLPDIVAT